MSFEELKEVFVDTLNCDADKVTMAASLTEDLQADSLDAVEPVSYTHLTVVLAEGRPAAVIVTCSNPLTRRS